MYPAVLDEDVPTGAAQLERYAGGRSAALRVRLILSTDGAYLTPDRRHKPTLPAGWTRGDWDFTPLDLLVGDVYAAGARPVIDIGYMPDWMWDCATGAPLDASFAGFGEYAARLVSYYNLGGFVAEDGRTVRNPAGTSRRVDTWELWNEPDFQTLACQKAIGSGAGLPPISSARYLAMWNAVAPRMRAVDPTIRLAGPSTAGGAGQSAEYLRVLMRNATTAPDIITFHAYGSYTPDETDACLFDGASAAGKGCSQGGIPVIVEGLRTMRSTAPGREIWLTEVNVLASYANDPHARNWNALGSAWEASAFVRLSAEGVNALFHYSFVHPGGNQFSVLDWTRGPSFGTPLLAYWSGYHLARFFPPGSRVLKSSAAQPGMDSLAVRLATGEVHVLLVNRKVADPKDVGGVGVASTIEVRVAGLDPSPAVTVWRIDGDTPPATGPVALTLGTGSSAALRLPGYSVTLLEFR